MSRSGEAAPAQAARRRADARRRQATALRMHVAGGLPDPTDSGRGHRRSNGGRIARDPTSWASRCCCRRWRRAGPLRWGSAPGPNSRYRGRPARQRRAEAAACSSAMSTVLLAEETFDPAWPPLFAPSSLCAMVFSPAADLAGDRSKPAPRRWLALGSPRSRWSSISPISPIPRRPPVEDEARAPRLAHRPREPAAGLHALGRHPVEAIRACPCD